MYNVDCELVTNMLDCQCGTIPHTTEVPSVETDEDEEKEMTEEEVDKIVKEAIQNARKAIDSSSDDVSMSVDCSASTGLLDRGITNISTVEW